jgi:hypothetical protein
MMTVQRKWYAAATLVAAMIGPMTSARAAIVYLDATDEVGGNTALAAGGAFTAVAATSGSDGNWAQRAFGNSGSIFESRGQSGAGNSTEDAPRLATTISGLTPGGAYNVYSFFWDSTDAPQQWMIRSGLTNVVGDLPLFDQTSPLANTLTFTSPVLTTEGNRTMLSASLGMAIANGSGQVVVYADDNTAGLTTGENRTWFDGVGYEAVPEPSTALLALGAAGLSLLRRRR